MVRWRDFCAPSAEGLCLCAPSLPGFWANWKRQVQKVGFFSWAKLIYNKLYTVPSVPGLKISHVAN